jgi:hypothetical protein
MVKSPGSPHSEAITLEKIMSFALYMLGFVIFLGGIIWGAVVAGVPTVYIGIGSLIILGIGIFSAVGRTRGKDPS